MVDQNQKQLRKVDMYEFKEVTEEQKEEYDGVVAKQPDAHVFQSYEWGEVKGWSGWRPHRFMLMKDGEPSGGAQVLVRPLSKLKKSILYAPCGPAVDLADPEQAAAFSTLVKSLARTEGGVFVKLDPPVTDDREDLKASLRDAGFRSAKEEEGGFEGIQPRCVMHLDIRGTEDEILARMTEKWRYNIRLAARKGVEIRIGKNDKDIQEFYEILKVTGKRDGFLIRSYNYFKKMRDVMEPKDMFRLFIAEYEGEPIAATIALAFSDKCWYVYGASGNEHRNVMPNHALQWAMIKWAKDLGCPVYDFRGIPCSLSPEHPLYGLVRFKKGFGAYPVHYVGEYEMVFSPVYAWLHRRGMPAYTTLRKLVRK